MSRRILPITLLLILAARGAPPARAGVVNPDISVLGQPLMRWTNDLSSPSPKRVTFDQGEVEMVYDAYLNPYAKGYFVVSLAPEGIDLEEGYFTLLRGLPGGLALKGGKCRVNFGKLNPTHHGQRHIMPSGSGNSAQMAEDSPILLCVIVSGIQRSPALREAGSLRSYFDQEGQCS
jgi:hypothetical protein